MTALLTIRLAGSVVQSCDARCYGAKNARCDCLCGSQNHGVGLEQAITNARRLMSLWLDDARESGVDFDELLLDDTILQEPLFTIGVRDDDG